MMKTLLIGMVALVALACGGGGSGMDGGGGGGGGDPVPFAGRWNGSISGGAKGTLNMLIAPKGALSMNGNLEGGTGFSGSGKVTKDGVITGTLADGAGDFTGQVSLGGIGLVGTLTWNGKTGNIALRKE